MPARRKLVWISIGALVLIALLIAWALLPLKDWLREFSEWTRSLGLIGVAVISGVYVLGTLLLIPGFPMTLAVAVVYGWWALAICFLGGLLAAAIAFLLGRHLARDLVKRLLRDHPAAKAADTVTREETFKTILLARLTPITPFAMENYAFGATGARFGAYFLATAIGVVPGTILNVWIGVIGRTAATGETSALGWSLLVLGLLATALLTVWMTRKAKLKLRERDSP